MKKTLKLNQFQITSAHTPNAKTKAFSFLDLLVVVLAAIVLSAVLPVLTSLVVGAIESIAYGLVHLVLPLTACILAVRISGQRHAIHSLLHLMGLFLVTATIYFVNGAEYFALVFSLIGQGAVAILFLYAVILLPLRAAQASYLELFKHESQTYNLGFGWAMLLNMLMYCNDNFYEEHGAINEVLHAATENTSTVAVRFQLQNTDNDILAFAQLYTEASALFYLVTVILLVAMLGSIVLATTSSVEDQATSDNNLASVSP